MLDRALERLRNGLSGTPYEGTVYLVGGYVRDKLLGRPLPSDVDLVLEGDALSNSRSSSTSGASPTTRP
jgi:poly(A) polymerase